MSLLPASPSSPSATSTSSCSGQRSYVGWIHDAATLGGEGVEHYDEFFPSYDERDVAPVMDAMARDGADHVDALLLAGLHASGPRRAAAAGGAAEDAPSTSVGAHRREVLPDAERAEVSGSLDRRGRRPRGRVHHAVARLRGEARRRSCASRTTTRSATGCTPEFAQQEEPFLALLDAVPESAHFGVQYDPSNAVVGGFDPIAFLEKIKHRVVTMHASDRYLVPGTTLEEIQLAGRDGRLPRQAAPRRDRARARTTTTRSSGS